MTAGKPQLSWQEYERDRDVIKPAEQKAHAARLDYNAQFAKVASLEAILQAAKEALADRKAALDRAEAELSETRAG